MQTDALIESLSQNTFAASPARLGRQALLVVAFGAVLALVYVFWLGLRPDMGAMLREPDYWLKIFGGLATAALSAAWLWSLGRPDAPPARAVPAALFLLLAFYIALGGATLMMTPASARLSLWLGHSWSVCSRNIVVCAVPVFLAGMSVAKTLAPAQTRLAGWAAGLLAGGVGVLVYALHCPETGAPFVATWYVLGVIASGALGAVVAPRWLRW